MKHNINFGHFYIQSNLFLQLVTWYQCVNFVTFVCVCAQILSFFTRKTPKKKKRQKKSYSPIPSLLHSAKTIQIN